MFKIGDIVRPKRQFIGHEYCFQIIKIESSPFEKNSYRIQGIKQELDPTYGPVSHQHNLIMKVEHVLWKEDDLELTSNVELRYNVTNLNDMLDANRFNLDEITKEAIKNCKIEIDKMNKEEKEMEILDLYEERKIKVLDKDLLEAKENIKKEDEIQSIIIEMTNQVNTILENQGSEARYASHPNLYTLETEKKLDELDQMYFEKREELRSTLKEIRALFELTDDYNERIKILKNYDILDKKGKLSI